MTFTGVDYMAIGIAAIATFALGFIYYMVIMSKLCKSPDCPADAKPPATAHLVALVGAAVMAWVLAGLLGHLGAGQTTLKNGVVSGAYVWLGFVLPTLTVNYTYMGKKLCTIAIDAFYWLLALALQGAIIGGMATGWVWS